MGLQQHVWGGDVSCQVGALALQPRLLVIAGVVPGPAIEGAWLDMGGVVRRQVVAQHVALVHRAPDLAGGRLAGQARAVAEAGGIDVQAPAHGVGDQHIGPVPVLAPGGPEAVGLVVGDGLGHRLVGQALIEVALGAHRDEQALAVGREGKVARPVSAGGGAQLGDDHLGRAPGLQVAVAIGKADHPIGLGHIDPLRVGPRRVEGDAERLVQVGGEDRALGRMGHAARRAQDADPVVFGDEDVAIRRGAQHVGLVQTLVEHRHLEAGRDLGQGAGRRRDRLGHAHANRGEGRLQIGGRDVVADAGRVLLPVAEDHHAVPDHGVVDLGAGGVWRRHELRQSRRGGEAGRAEGEDRNRCAELGRHGASPG